MSKTKTKKTRSAKAGLSLTVDENQQRGLLDRFRWPSGIWDTEPDRIEWRDVGSKRPCLIKRCGLGAWCGYVGVESGHPWHGRFHISDIDVDIHGGLFYSQRCSSRRNNAGEELGICHVAEPGEPEPETFWWLGFHCAHDGDSLPGLFSFSQFGSKYRTEAYAREQVGQLARQIEEAQAHLGRMKITELPEPLDEVTLPVRTFREKLTSILNTESLENGSDTPDMILASYLEDCLLAFDRAVLARERWYGRTRGDVEDADDPQSDPVGQECGRAAADDHDECRDALQTLQALVEEAP